MFQGVRSNGSKLVNLFNKFQLYVIDMKPANRLRAETLISQEQREPHI